MLGSGVGLPYANSYQFWDPLTLSPATGGLSVWLKFDTAQTVAVTDIEQWKDVSGNNRHAEQSTPGNRATYSAGAADFESGEGDHYDFATSLIDIDSEEGFLLAMVCEVESVGSNMTILGLNFTK